MNWLDLNKILLIKKKYLFFIIYICLISCKNYNNKNSESVITQEILQENTQNVKYSQVQYGDFKLELNTIGKIYAKRKVDLKFVLNEKITSINVVNGQKIVRGQIIATQENVTYKNEVITAREQLERSKIDVEDILIGFNYSLKEQSKVPDTILNMAKNRSNYDTSLSNLNNANIEFESTFLKSPINGIVANLDTKVYTYPDNTEPFCTIIDNSIFEVEFHVIEDDYFFLSKDQSIKISTLLNEEEFSGVITEINPIVDENGMIKTKGMTKKVPSNIIDGMNVNITVERKIPDKIYVPKKSVVLRDNKKVIFTYDKGKAIWNYVETSFENGQYIVIEKGLKKEDKVIYSGNINLAHNSNVTLENE